MNRREQGCMALLSGVPMTLSDPFLTSTQLRTPQSTERRSPSLLSFLRGPDAHFLLPLMAFLIASQSSVQPRRSSSSNIPKADPVCTGTKTAFRSVLSDALIAS